MPLSTCCSAFFGSLRYAARRGPAFSRMPLCTPSLSSRSRWSAISFLSAAAEHALFEEDLPLPHGHFHPLRKVMSSAFLLPNVMRFCAMMLSMISRVVSGMVSDSSGSASFSVLTFLIRGIGKGLPCSVSGFVSD